MQTEVIRIPADEVNLIQGWLESNRPVPDSGETETIKTYTAQFVDGFDIEVDIKVCNSEEGPYIDAVIFEAGCEIGFLTVRDTLLGVYDFREDHDCYRVIVEKTA